MAQPATHKPTAMTRTRSLHDPADLSGKTWTTVCEGTQVRVLAGSAGKLKETSKDFDEPHDALAYALKQEWARLKKGQVLVHADAAPGEPRMHRYLGGTYTGAPWPIWMGGCCAAGTMPTPRAICWPSTPKPRK